MPDSRGSPLEQALTARQTIQQILESTGEPAYSVDDQGYISGWNPAAERLLGYSRERIIGQPCHRVLRGVDVFGNRYCEPDCPRLTQRELTVLRLLASGNTTREMATKISISPSTVRKHIQNLFNKLDVHTRLGAVSAALGKGIL